MFALYLFFFSFYYNDWWALHRKTIWSKHSLKWLQRSFWIWDYVRLQKFPFITLLDNMRIEPDDINIFLLLSTSTILWEILLCLGNCYFREERCLSPNSNSSLASLFHLRSHTLDSIKYSIFSLLLKIYIFFLSYCPLH